MTATVRDWEAQPSAPAAPNPRQMVATLTASVNLPTFLAVDTLAARRNWTYEQIVQAALAEYLKENR